jgi:hypothetical protein
MSSRHVINYGAEVINSIHVIQDMKLSIPNQQCKTEQLAVFCAHVNVNTSQHCTLRTVR